MVELRSTVGEALRRFRKFVLIVIWVVPLLLFSVFMSNATGASGAAGGKLKNGTGVVQSCRVDGWPGLRIWHQCAVHVRWEDGETGVVTIPPPDLEPADIGETVDVVWQRSGGNYEYRVDRSHPWAWVWWLTGAPAFCLALGLIALGGLVLVKGRVLKPGLLPFSRELRERRD